MIASGFGDKCHRILIFRGGAIGDFILTLPAIRALRDIGHKASIDLIGYPHIAELARVSGLIDNVIPLDSSRIASYFIPNKVLPYAEQSFVQSFNVIISCLSDPDEVVRSNLIRAGAKCVISISHKVTSGHAIAHWLKPLSQIGIHGAGNENAQLDLPVCCQVQGQHRLEQMALAGNIIAIHPGSGSPDKNWPLPCFIELAHRLSDECNAHPFFIIGEADEALARNLKNSYGQFPVLAGCSLLEVASVLSVCNGYIGNDSGITHLASALGIPTIALFGPTDPAVWGPRSTHMSIIRSDVPEEMESIPVDDVLNLAKKYLFDFAPVYRRQLNWW